MIGRVLEGRNTIRANLLSSRERQNLIDAKLPPTEEDVIDRVTAFAFATHFPRRVRRFLAVFRSDVATFAPVSRVKVETGIGPNGGVDGLGGFSVEIARHNDGAIRDVDVVL